MASRPSKARTNRPRRARQPARRVAADPDLPVGGGLHRQHAFGADLRGADLTGADLRGARFEKAILEGANLTGAQLEKATFRGANLKACTGCPAPVAQ
jgi:hypothetical protein